MAVDFGRMVGNDENTVLLRKLRDAQRFSESRRPRRVELQILDRTAFDEVAHGEPMDLALAVGQRYARGCRKLHVIVRLQVPVQRFLEPRDSVGLDTARKAYAVIEAVSRVHVEHQQYLAPDRFA